MLGRGIWERERTGREGDSRPGLSVVPGRKQGHVGTSGEWTERSVAKGRERKGGTVR